MPLSIISEMGKLGYMEANSRAPGVTVDKSLIFNDLTLPPAPDSRPTPSGQVKPNEIMSRRALKCLEAAAPGPPRGR